MTINAMIPLATEVPNLARSVTGGAVAGNQLMNLIEDRKLAPMRQQAAQMEVEAGKITLSKEKAIEQLRNAAIDGSYIRRDLASGDLNTAISRMEQRNRRIMESGGDNQHTQQWLSALSSRDPAQIQAVAAEMEEIERAYQTYGGGGGVTAPVDPRTTKQKNLESAGIMPGTPEYTKAMMGGQVAPTTNVYMAAEAKGLTEEQKALAKSRVSQYEGYRTQADNAIDQDETLRQLENIDIKTGFGQETRGNIANAINSLFGAGTGDEILNTNASAMQSFRAISKKMQAAELNKAKGPQTEGDAQRIAETLARMQNETDANRFLIQSLRATNSRYQERADFYEGILERDGSLKKADGEWSDYKRKTPMVSDSVRNKATGLPMFFNEFKAQARERNPQATDEQIVNAWRELQ